MKPLVPFAAFTLISLSLMGAGCNLFAEEADDDAYEMMQDDSMMKEKESMESDSMMKEDDAMEAAAFNATHTVNLDQSRLEWSGEKITGSGHFGTISLTSGSMEVAEDGMIKGGKFVFDMSSIILEDSTGKTKESVENHLKSADFFDAENHPEGSFIITNVEQTPAGFIVTGDLTLKGITQPVAFPATVETTEEGTMLSTAEITLDRTLWDIRFGSGKFFDDLGDNLIKDEIQISLAIEAEQI